MAYSTYNDILANFGEDELSKVTSSESPDTDKIANTIVIADSYIDAYLIGRVNINQEQVPDIIRKISSDLAYVLLCEYYYSYLDTPNSVIRMKRDIFELLSAFANGSIKLANASSASNIIGNISKI